MELLLDETSTQGAGTIKQVSSKILFHSCNYAFSCHKCVLIMYPRLYMHSLQYVFFNSDTSEVTFATRHVSGRRFNFILTRNQFLSLHDAITLIDKDNSYGHFPLGQSVWLHYNAFDASLYRDPIGGKRVYFTFACFEEYKSYTHRRILMLVRSNEDSSKTTRDWRTGRRYRGRQRAEDDDDEVGEDRAHSSDNKRSLPIELRTNTQSPTSKRARWRKRKTASRPTDNVIVPNDDEEGSIFSEWHSSNARRRCDSISSMSCASQDLPSPETVQFSDNDNSCVES